MLNWRNPKHTANGAINVEIEHEEFGWIPFTARDDDPEERGRELFAAIVASGESIAPYVAPTIDASQVDAERERRSDTGFYFEGVLYQSREQDRENIAGAKAAATDAIMLGAQAGDLAWQQLIDSTAPSEFRWIAADNTEHSMDAQTMVRLGYAALKHKQAMILAARALKNMDPIPSDFATNEAYWA